MKRVSKQERALFTLLDGKELQHGSDFERMIRIDDLDVKVTIAPRRAVAGTVDLLALAFDALDQKAWSARGCAASVKDRGYHLRKNSMKSCEIPIAFVIGRQGQRWTGSGYENRTFVTFACRLHKEAEAAERDVIGVTAISSVTFKRWREEITKRDAERERFRKMTEEERVANDAKLVGHPAAKTFTKPQEPQELRVDSIGKCSRCSYEGPGPMHDCRPKCDRRCGAVFHMTSGQHRTDCAAYGTDIPFGAIQR